MQAKWIWENDSARPDEYADFKSEFDFVYSEQAVLKISADSNYVVYINGKQAAFGQYPDRPDEKVFDEIQISEYCRPGRNEIQVTVWYYGEGNFSYIPWKAGLLFEVCCNGEVRACSCTDTLSRIDPLYVSHRQKKITFQLGYGYACNAENESEQWHKSVENGDEVPLRPRPIKRLRLENNIAGKIIRNEDNRHFLIDIGHEEVGFLYFDLVTEKTQNIQISYGEHILDGWVRKKIGSRDFCVEYRAKAGKNVFADAFRRLGGRYLEVTCEEEICLREIGLRPVVYPLAQNNTVLKTEIEQRIYDVCVKTLQLCMHDHYEDCPWREQALYCMDSRNQMLAGYYAFGETQFPRASLEMMVKDKRADGLLSITFPCDHDLTIPSFGLHWFTQMKEYLVYSGDRAFILMAWDKLNAVLRVFLNQMKDGIVYTFTEASQWNFYEWIPELSGKGGEPDESRADVLLNALTVMALESMEVMAKITNAEKQMDYSEIAQRLRNASRRYFFEDPTVSSEKTGVKTELGMSLAVLAGIADGKETCREIVASRFSAATLSMKCFVYDALLFADFDAYKDFVLDDIRKNYTFMLQNDATTFWETVKGAEDFDGAGSLCHGWSAIPIYYYHILGRVK